MLAIIRGSVAFFAPEIGICHRAGVRRRCVCDPCPAPASAAYRLILRFVRDNSGGFVAGVACRHRQRCPGCLRLAALAVFPQRGRGPPGTALRHARLCCRPSYPSDGRAASQRPATLDIAGLIGYALASLRCCRSSVVEHSLGKGEVDSSILSGSTILHKHPLRFASECGFCRS